jgi:hypothetical protein
MINYISNKNPPHPTLDILTKQLVRTHVSRYPITAEVSGSSSIHFFDYRHRDKPVMLLVYMGGGQLSFRSPFIKNEKYKENNSNYETKQTNNMTKARKILAEYVRPYTSHELTKYLHNDAGNAFLAWKHEFTDKLRKALFYVGSDDILNEIVNYANTGIMYGTDKFKELTKPDKLELIRTHKERDTEMPKKHVYVQPDGVVFSCDAEKVWGNFTMGEVSTYNSVYELPDDLRGNVALLRMAEDKAVVNKVGLRLDANSFWVY